MGEGDDEVEEKLQVIFNEEDCLQVILSKLPLLDLLSAYFVSKLWRRVVCSCMLDPLRTKPWLVVYVQTHLTSSFTRLRAYDSYSHLWNDIPCPRITFTSPIRSSCSQLLYILTPSSLTFSFHAVNTTWCTAIGPRVRRVDPIVSLVGSCIVVAAGTQFFEHDPLAVELYDTTSGQWEICESLPQDFTESPSSTWISVAASDQEMFLLEKNSVTLCTFDVHTRTWGSIRKIKLNESLSLSLLGYLKNKCRLVLIGLVGDSENVTSLKVWDIDPDTLNFNQLGEMPPRMLRAVMDSSFSPTSIDIAISGDMIYMYHSTSPNEIVICELKGGSCDWGIIQTPIVSDQNPKHTFALTASTVSLHDLHKAFSSCNI